MRKEQRERREANKVDQEPVFHPDLLVYWDPQEELGVDTSVEVYKHDETCEVCLHKGSYVIRDDKNSLGICRKHFMEKGSQIIKVVELPSTHEY